MPEKRTAGKPAKVGFFGTPGIAAYCLERISGIFDVRFVVTGEDKPVGRHQHIVTGPVKTFARSKDIPVYQPSRLRDMELAESLRSHDADIFVVVAYGKLIPESIFNMPRLRTINLHPSLLPLYRGAAPVEWSLIRGEKFTGVTVQMINERLDAGDIILQETIPLSEDTTAEELYQAVFPMGADMLIRAVELLQAGQASPVPQEEGKATFCGKIDRDTAHCDWSRSAGEIHNLVRGLSPRPAVWTTFREKNVKIYRTRLVRPESFQDSDSIRIAGLGPGEIAVAGRKCLLAGTGSGTLEILEIQPETKKVMDAASFINGSRLSPGEFFI